MAKVEQVGACWVWTGSVGSSGYGKVTHQGPPRRDLSTHRTVWEHHRGPVPQGLVLDHLCCVIRCCNPDHLEPVTQAENRRRQSLRRTACNRGHEYVEGSYRDSVNGRDCLACAARREAARRVRNRRADYAERCDRGHTRTDENTVAQGSGLRCKRCTAEAAQARRHRERLESGSGSAP